MVGEVSEEKMGRSSIAQRRKGGAEINCELYGQVSQNSRPRPARRPGWVGGRTDAGEYFPTLAPCWCWLGRDMWPRHGRNRGGMRRLLGKALPYDEFVRIGLR